MDGGIAYDPLLVCLSIVIAIQASYVALRVTVQVSGARGSRRQLLLVGASLSLAMGIWGMHFVGMLAAHLPVGIEYEILPTLISFLLCVIVVGFAIVGASLWRRTLPTLLGTAVVMGLGIATMHYVGMMALHDSLHMTHRPLFVLASVLMAISASAAALWLATMPGRRPALILCAVLLGLAISSMHYIAMAGTTIHVMEPLGVVAGPSLSSGLLAIVVAIVAFFVSSGFFLTLVPQPESETLKHPADAAWKGREASEPAPSRAPTETNAPIGLSSTEEKTGPVDAPVSVAIPGAMSTQLPEAAVSAPRALKPVPVERDGARIMLAPNEIYAVRANAHYCSIYNGREDLFCSLSISEVEEHLQGGPFARVHRSHIVNLDRIAVIRKTADGGFADLSGEPRVSVPISRSKVNEVREQVAGRGASSGHCGG